MGTLTIPTSSINSVLYNGSKVSTLVVDGVTAWVDDPMPAYADKLATAATTRDLSEFTWEQLSAIAADISSKGTGSACYAAAVNCAKNGAYKTTTYSGSTAYATLIGVNQGTYADGNAAGMSFMVSKGVTSASALMGASDGVTNAAMNSSNTNSGGWGASAMRSSQLGSSTSAIAANFASDLKAVVKKRHVPYNATYSATTSYTMSYTDDFMWLLSFSEVYGDAGMNDAFVNSWWGISGSRPWMRSEGEQFLWFKDKGMYGNSSSDYNFTANSGGSTYRWLRSCSHYSSGTFGSVNYYSGGPNYGYASFSSSVFPCFSI